MKENITYVKCSLIGWHFRADSRLAPSQWETSLQSNAVSHWLGANLETALHFTHMIGISPWEKSPDVLGVFSPLSYAHYIDINTMKFTFVKNTSPFNENTILIYTIYKSSDILTVYRKRNVHGLHLFLWINTVRCYHFPSRLLNCHTVFHNIG